MAKTKRWTLAEIKDMNNENGYFFFSKNTMKFFKDKMSDFKVYHRDGQVIVHRKKDGKEWEFNTETGSIHPLPI